MDFQIGGQRWLLLIYDLLLHRHVVARKMLESNGKQSNIQMKESLRHAKQISETQV